MARESSFRAFAEGLIDYAGLFPPAELPFDKATRLYASHLSGPDGWILSRFLCPAGRLEELERALEGNLRPIDPLRLSLILGGGGSTEAFEEAIRRGAERAAAFQADRRGRVAVEAFEVRLPDAGNAAREPDAIALLAAGSMEHLDRVGLGSVHLFLEPSLAEGAAGSWTAAFEGLRALPARWADHRPGIKLRCGGATAASFPSSALLASALAAAAEAGTPIKATAGLHHPFPRIDAATGARMHGFLNLFGAALLGSAHALPASRLQEILDDDDPLGFRFEADGFSWRGLRVGTAEITELRRTRATSFGSCSFDEPRDDLYALGLLPCEHPEER